MLQEIEKAIQINGISVDSNTKAFLWGRRTAHNDKRVRELIASQKDGSLHEENLDTLDKKIQHRVDFLKAYQNKAYAHR